MADVEHEEQRAPVLALVRLEPVVEIELCGLGPQRAERVHEGGCIVEGSEVEDNQVCAVRESKRSGSSCTLCAIVVQFDAALRSIGEWIISIMGDIQWVGPEP